MNLPWNSRPWSVLMRSGLPYGPKILSVTHFATESDDRFSMMPRVTSLLQSSTAMMMLHRFPSLAFMEGAQSIDQDVLGVLELKWPPKVS